MASTIQTLSPAILSPTLANAEFFRFRCSVECTNHWRFNFYILTGVFYSRSYNRLNGRSYRGSNHRGGSNRSSNCSAFSISFNLNLETFVSMLTSARPDFDIKSIILFNSFGVIRVRLFHTFTVWVSSSIYFNFITLVNEQRYLTTAPVSTVAGFSAAFVAVSPLIPGSV